MYRPEHVAAKHTAIVIVHYGQSNLTLRCLASVFKYCQGDYRVYLVDNASPDHSLAEIRQKMIDPRLIILPQTDNLGFGVGVNKGIERALLDGAEHVLLLNNDTWIEHDILTPLRAYNQSFKGQCLITGEIQTPEGQVWYGGGDYSLWTMRVRHRINRIHKVRKTHFVTGCYLWLSADVLSQLKGFDTRYFLYLEDLDLSLRAQQLGISIMLVPGVAIKHTGSATTGGRHSMVSVYYQNRNRFLIINDYAGLFQRYVFYFFYSLGFFKRFLSGAAKRKASLWALRDASQKRWGKRVGI